MPTLLVVGCGSVGKRHARNLADLGCAIVGTDPREDRMRELVEAIPGAQTAPSIASAIDRGGLDAVVIASPPSVHVEQSMQCLAAGLPLLLEKPVAPDLASATRLRDEAARREVPVLLGYTFRWWPPILQLRDLVQQQAVGRVLRVEMHLAAHLADWHPWERYQDFFMAQAALGGGALLDESHFIDLALWMFGGVRDVYGTVAKLSDLEIDTDDNVDALLGCTSGVRVSLHLDLFARPHQRKIRVYGDAGTIEWDNEANLVRVCRTAAAAWDDTRYDCQRNDMFVAEAKEFLDVVRGAPPSCTIADGVEVLRVVEAIRQSSASGRRVEFQTSA